MDLQTYPFDYYLTLSFLIFHRCLPAVALTLGGLAHFFLFYLIVYLTIDKFMGKLRLQHCICTPFSLLRFGAEQSIPRKLA